MRAAALRAIADAEVIAYLHPLPEFPAPPLAQVAKLDRAPRAPIVTVYTKADLVPTSSNLPQPPPTSSVVVSALTGSGLDQLLAALRERVPEGPFHYDPDAMATQPMRFFAAEFVREAAFELLHEELPYSVAVEIDEFREGQEPVYIRAVVYVERASQKGIRPARDSRLPQVQRATRAPHGARRSAGVSHLPPDLRRRRRHPHHAHR